MTDWPETLPTNWQSDGFYEELPDLDILSPVDFGPDIGRKRGTATTYPIGGNMKLTAAQWATLSTFYLSVTRSLPFNFVHDLEPEVTLSVKFAKPPRRVPATPGRFLVNIDFLVQP